MSLGARLAELELLVAQLTSDNEILRVENSTLRAENDTLRAEIVALKSKGSKHSGNSSMPPSRDQAGERQRQSVERQASKQRRNGGTVRRAGGQPGATGTTLTMTDTPDQIEIHTPDVCGGCGNTLDGVDPVRVQRRQVVDVPPVVPVVTEHQVLTKVCPCCQTTTSGDFPDHVRAPISYGPRVRAFVVYLLARQHLPIERCRETVRDMCGIRMSTGTIDAIYTDAARRLAGFITTLTTALRAMAVIHVDETSDRVGTQTCWMHVVSTRMLTLIHASTTRGVQAVHDAGVLAGYTGIIVHDRLAMYWQFTRARHQACGAHLIRDLAHVAEVATQKMWATAMSRLLVEINDACDDARTRRLKTVAPQQQRQFAARYDQIVTDAHTANPPPASGRKRNRLERDSHNLATAFTTHRAPILRFMYNLESSFTNNQAERDLRPVKIHRKISSCFRQIEGAQRFATVRSYLSTTRKNDIPAINALTDLFNNQPWLPTAA